MIACDGPQVQFDFPRNAVDVLAMERRGAGGPSHNHNSRKRKQRGDGAFARAWHKLRHLLRLDELSPAVRRWVVGLVGGTLLLAGIAMIVLPGPAFIVIPLALALLGTEFVWAKRWVEKARNLLKRLKASATSK